MDWKNYNKTNQERRAASRDEAGREFDDAKRLAISYGFELKKKSEGHYQLIYHPQVTLQFFIYNIYPGNHRIYADPNHTGPFLELNGEWGLIDVVMSAAEKMGLIREKK